MAPSLLSLPPELRYAIYHVVISEDTPPFEIGAAGHILNQPGLLAVCRQIRHEALPIHQNYVPTAVASISVNILGFDFAALMSYIDTLSPEQREAVASNGSLSIKLTLSDDHEQRHAWQNLGRWLRYCGTELATRIISTTGPTPKDSAYRFVGDIPQRRITGVAELSTIMASVTFAAPERTTGGVRPSRLMNAEWGAVRTAWEERRAGMRREEQERERARVCATLQAQYQLLRTARIALLAQLGGNLYQGQAGS
ncbi:hypothetical protein B0A55_08181 [Friedmanniomyces simplex]|uniref:F-box domain-containing protein n=1 Tax=Friedmanniomyces simplex TaxID=329884 RepID=A0A4U0WV01_9PEZI|nr:hypothetical protein B0A55_08181 [Friedmanniomyces simplex]